MHHRVQTDPSEPDEDARRQFSGPGEAGPRGPRAAQADGLLNTSPRLRAPVGACDAHIHVFDRRFPLRPDLHFTPFEATVEQYRQVQARLRLTRVVVVQSSAYGSDNRCLLDALRALGSDARGIAMVPASVPDGELAGLRAAGVVGLRFLMAPGGIVAWDEVARLAARATEHGLLINLQLDGRTLPDHEPLLARLPGTLVIDHVGMFKAAVGADHPGFAALLRLLESGRTWVKLSAPYAGGLAGPPPYPAVGALARALAAAAPGRLVWGSNWPHPFSVTQRGGIAEDDGMLLDLLADWVPDPAVVLAANAAALFGFPAPEDRIAPDGDT